MAIYMLNWFTNISFAFANISTREIVDILLVTFLIYVVLLFVKQTRSYFVITVATALVIIGFLSQNLNLALTRTILQPISTLTFIIIAIVFQKEIRQFFRWITVSKYYFLNPLRKIADAHIDELTDALRTMARKKTGAIIVFQGKQSISELLEGGQALGGAISKEILFSIFDHHSAGHDGAVIIEKGIITRFGVHLPLAKEYADMRSTGTRHRAAAGITEETDVVAFAVSEERGTISLFKGGVRTVLKTESDVRKALNELSDKRQKQHISFWNYFFKKNLSYKLLALLIAVFLWSTILVQTGVTKKEFEIPLVFQLLPSGYEIDSRSGRQQIAITVLGKSTDISTLDVKRIEAKIDGKNLTIGTNTIPVTKEMINVPSFVTISEIEPLFITVIVNQIGNNIFPAPEAEETTDER